MFQGILETLPPRLDTGGILCSWKWAEGGLHEGRVEVALVFDSLLKAVLRTRSRSPASFTSMIHFRHRHTITTLNSLRKPC